MRHLDLLNEFRTLLSQLRNEVEAASAMQLYDTHKISEEIMLKLFRKLYDLPDLRNLNADQKNFPSIDLADDAKRVAIQVTSTSSLDKVKNTLEIFIRERLYERYDKLIIYVLTRKQNSYSQGAINKILAGKFNFIVDEDIHDFQDLCDKSISTEPKKLQVAVNELKAYLRGVDIGLADEDTDPPLEPREIVTFNLIDLAFPSELYIGELKQEILFNKSGRKRKNIREAVRNFGQELGIRFPSAYIVHGGRLITFFNLEIDNNPYSKLIENGTIECLSSKEFYEIDEDYERVFKALLRFSLQQRLFKEYVTWYKNENQFVFLPKPDDGDIREESWMDKRMSTRKVFERKYNKKDISKIFYQKHLAFSVDFVRFDDDWNISITPTWFFSYGENFEKSGFADENISWLKRQETNRSVFNHFRFLSAWLRDIDEVDIFSIGEARDDFLSFGKILTVHGHPNLDETLWASLPDEIDHVDLPERRGFFA